MPKKKKAKKKGSFTIIDKQISTLDFVKIKAEATIKECERLIRKIEQEGTKGFYSINSDVLRHSLDVWKGCIRLSELKKISDENNIQS